MSIQAVHNLNIFLGLGAIALQVFSVAILLVFFFGPKKNTFLNFIDKYFLAIGFLISLFATMFSLVYSEIVGFLPCVLCWWQRVFLFPQVFIFGVALFQKEKRAMQYSFPLILVGSVIALYQTVIYYISDSANIPCDASGVSCYQHLVSLFGGYISIPSLSITAFLSLLVLISVVYFYGKREQ